MRSISVVIPMYNEGKRIKKAVEEMNEYLDENPGSEVLFIDDGSTDSTCHLVCKHKKNKRIRLIRAGHQGKWGAIRIGYFNARKKVCVALDADLSVAEDALEDIKSIAGKKIVIGNRFGKFESSVPLGRYIASRGFNFLVKRIAGVQVNDSQCPFKILPKNKVFDGIMWRLKERGFAGDVELLKRAILEGVKVVEMDVFYDFEEGSKVNVKKHGFEMLRALFRIRRIT